MTTCKRLFRLTCLFFLLGSRCIWAQPVINSFAPLSGPVGTAVALQGTGFDATPANNVVYIGGIRATVTAASATTLTATVPPSAAFTPITVTVNGLTGFSAQPFNVTFGGGSKPFNDSSFTTKVNYQNGASLSTGFTCSDLDGDGKPDVVVVMSGVLAIYRNSGGNGVVAFDNRVEINGGNVVSTAVADIDGDGLRDIVINANGSVMIYRNTSTPGAISFAQLYYFGGSVNSRGPYIADMNGDGKPEIITCNLTDKTIRIVQNNSTPGALSFAGPLTFVQSGTMQSLAVGDIDGDGKPDIAAALYDQNKLTILRNTGTGGAITFAAGIEYTTGRFPNSIAMGDWDGDGKADLAVLSPQAYAFMLFANNSTPGNISLAAGQSYATDAGPQRLLAADMDGDGRPDLASINTGLPPDYKGTVSVLRNTSTTGNFSFSAKTDYPTSRVTNDFTLGDLDGDSKPDIITNGDMGVSSLMVLRNRMNEPVVYNLNPVGGLTGATIKINGNNFTGTTAVSFGGTSAASFQVVSDNEIDAVVGAGSSGKVTVATPYSTTNFAGFEYFAAPAPVISSFTPVTAAVGASVTINGNNFNPAASSNVVAFGGVKATVTAASSTALTVTVPGGNSYQPVTVTSNGLTAYSGLSFGTTYSGANTPLTANSFSQRIGFAGQPMTNLMTCDMNDDGKPDVVGVASGHVAVYTNSSNAQSILFTEKLVYAYIASATCVGVGDMDGDGKPDLALGGNSFGGMGVIQNTSSNGNLSFGSYQLLDSAIGSSRMVLRDIDMDGKPDIIQWWENNTSETTVSILRNTSVNGVISFAKRIKINTGSVNGLCVADLDGDGKPELVISNNASNTVSVYRNNSTLSSISFAAAGNFTVAAIPAGVAVGDLDADGRQDLVVTNIGGTSPYPTVVSVLKNTSGSGAISFAAKADFTVGNRPIAVSINDVDGDGKPDLLVSNNIDNKISVLRNTGSGSIGFSSQSNYADDGGTMTDIVSADLDGDNHPEILVLDGSTDRAFSVYKNQLVASPLQYVAPVISSVSPSSGPVGSTVTI
ncbi:MAG: VCBS repeat-containing protein, partial [Bacteroidetes bacterium]|nr:VCBS repeat-containing protein [Bacteroidota bacterium]